MRDEDVTEQVAGEAAKGHEGQEGDPAEAWRGEGNQPEGTGYAPPDSGVEEAPESEIPVGVDAIDADASGGGDDDGGNAPIDLAALDTGDDAGDGAATEPADVSDAADAPAAEDEGGAADVSDAAEAPDAEDQGEASGVAEGAEAPAAEGEAEPPDAEAAEPVDVADAAEAPAAEEGDAEAAEAPPEPAAEGDDDEEEKTGDPDKYSAGGDVELVSPEPQSGLDLGEAQKAGVIPTEFRVPPGVPGGVDPGKAEDRDIPPKPQT